MKIRKVASEVYRLTKITDDICHCCANGRPTNGQSRAYDIGSELVLFDFSNSRYVVNCCTNSNGVTDAGDRIRSLAVNQ